MTLAHRKVSTSHSLLDQSRQLTHKHPYLAGLVAAVVAAAASALINRHLAKKAEHNNPPLGQFLDIDGVRLHYLERGSGEPLVLLHGNGSMIADFQSSGLIDLAAKSHRVIVFDRPGFGHSNRPRSVVRTPNAQAELIYFTCLVVVAKTGRGNVRSNLFCAISLFVFPGCRFRGRCAFVACKSLHTKTRGRQQ